ncbi:MAG: hypothetical protein A3J38_08690 [Gammaproteobacteria bacterium RIFCSPHIGHO2_12_FULL_45_9]|nr:MAG: hypothetical protein A3J38_08690 [Gammaproteobacteria bacterium RIFCSPHIGHO2_12_FULL_45_9]
MAPQQAEATEASAGVAKIRGEWVKECPVDLYIPPDALRIFLEAFEGPLDLLLYLIRKQNIDILDIPIAEITRQYLSYVELMREFQLELAAEYLLMAAILAEIKSRLLLPVPPAAEGEPEPADPRAELVRRLQEYERFQRVALDLDQLTRLERDTWCATAFVSQSTACLPALSPVALHEITHALKDVLARAALYEKHRVVQEPLSIRERMTAVLMRFQDLPVGVSVPFVTLFRVEEGRMGVVVTLIAILELSRQSVLSLQQDAAFGPLYVHKCAPVAENNAL